MLDMLQGSQYLVWYFQVTAFFLRPCLRSMTFVVFHLITSFYISPILHNFFLPTFLLFIPLLPCLRIHSLAPILQLSIILSLLIRFCLFSCTVPLPIQCLGATIGRNVCLYPNGGDPMMTEPVRAHRCASLITPSVNEPGQNHRSSIFNLSSFLLFIHPSLFPEILLTFPSFHGIVSYLRTW